MFQFYQPPTGPDAQVCTCVPLESQSQTRESHQGQEHQEQYGGSEVVVVQPAA